MSHLLFQPCSKGGAWGFDFNDVVVDVEENTTITHKVTYENGVKKSDEIISQVIEPTKAVIRAMGGTIDFKRSGASERGAPYFFISYRKRGRGSRW